MTDEEADRIAQRAERLAALIALIGEEPSMEPGDSGLAGNAAEVLGDMSSEGADADLDLAWECADLGRELREEAWRWFQWATYCLSRPRVTPKAARAPGGMTGPAGERVRLLTFEEALHAPYWLLGWLAPTEPVVPISEECARYAQSVELSD